MTDDQKYYLFLDEIQEIADFENMSKYYVADTGLLNSILNYRQVKPSHALENIVFLELIRQGYKVDAGEIKDYEVDFVCRNSRGIVYVQVAWSIDSEEKLAQELKSFESLRDNYPKVIISKDTLPVSDLGNGIRKINTVDFLLGNEVLN